MLQQAPFVDRNNFGTFLNDNRLLGEAVEVGTHRGEFATQLLRKWKGRQLYCVDNWASGYDKGDPASNGNRTEDFVEYRKATRDYRTASRVTTIREDEETAVDRFAGGSLDFAYLDANHQPDNVYESLRRWWPKIKTGGILAGHDFICPGEPDGGWGRLLQPVILEFAEEVGESIYLVVETLCLPWSFFLFKS